MSMLDLSGDSDPERLARNRLPALKGRFRALCISTSSSDLGQPDTIFSFDATSYAAGLSSMCFGKFCLAAALGMAPGIFAFVYLGGASPGLDCTWS
jgi:hypothetical protein